MLIDRSHLPWGIFSAIVLTAGAILYAVCAAIAPHGPSGRTVPGLCFGIIATAMMTFSVLLAARKAFRTRRAGSASFWMKGHIWLGSLSVPFLLFHSGFSWGGTISGLLWMCVLFVVGSGLLALLLQQILPAIMIRLISLTFVSHFLKKNKQNKFQSNTRAKNNFNMMKNKNGTKKQKERNNQ